MTTSRSVAFKRPLTDITIAANNGAVKKLKVEKSSDSLALPPSTPPTNPTENSVDTAPVQRRRGRPPGAKAKPRSDPPALPSLQRRRGRPPGAKNKPREPRAGPHALLDAARSPSPVILPPRRSIRRAQMETARRLLLELNAELRALHEASLQPSELPEDEEVDEPSQEDHIAEALRDLGMCTESQPVANREQQPGAHIDDFVQLSQFLEESPDPEAIASAAGVTRGRAGAFYRDGRSLGRKWMEGRMLGHKLEPYKLSELLQESNRCPYCKAYQYEEECRDKSEREKY